MTEFTSVGLWSGECSIVADHIFANPIDSNITRTKYPFCEVELSSSTEFSGSLGFGRMTTWDAAMQYTYTGNQFVSMQTKPQVTFNLTFNTNNSITVGAFDDSADALKWTSNAQNSEQWALNIGQVGFSSAGAQTNTNNYPSVLASDFPYIAIPSELWATYLSNLTKLDFVCFKETQTETSVCQTKKSCSSILNELNPLNLQILFSDGHTGYHEIESDVYLMESNGQCKSLITQANNATTSTEWMILGTPFFRTTIMSFDYYNDTIGISTKDS